jgi:ankyrin repeat protein
LEEGIYRTKRKRLSLGEQFIQAAKDNNIKKAKHLLKKGVDIDSRDGLGRTALMCASESGCKEIAEFLIHNGSDVNAKSEDELTALMYASLNNRIEIVKNLIKNKADVTARDINDSSALTIALCNEHEEIAEFLKAHGTKE